MTGGARSSLVNIASMGNASDTDELCRVVNNVDHSPVAHPDAPLVLVTSQLFAPGGPRGSAQCLQPLQDTR